MSTDRPRRHTLGGLAALLFLLGLLLLQPPASHAADRIYWASFDTGAIQWANLDGSGGIHDLNPGNATVSPEGYGAGGTIDPVQGRYYWINQYDRKLLWANLDGSGGGDLNIGAAKIDSSSYGLSIDPAGRRIYWGTDGSIEYANLDGSGGGTLDIGEASVNSAIGTTFYPTTGSLFWANGGSGSNSIYSAKVDGSGGAQLELSGTGPIEYPFGLAIDASAQRIYWSNDNATGSISVANLDGSNSAEIAPRGLDLGGGNYGIALDPEAGRVYTAEFAHDQLVYLNTNGTGGATVPVQMPKNNGPNFPVLYKEPRATSALTLTAKPPLLPRVLKKAKNGKRRPSPLPKLIGSRLSCSGGTFAPDLVEAHFYRAPVTVEHALTRDGQEVESFLTITGRELEAGLVNRSPTAKTPGNYRCQESGTNIAGTTTLTSPPVPIFKTGKLKLNTAKGTAKLTVELPADKGPLKLVAKGFRTVSKNASGKTVVLVAPKGSKKAKLASKGKLKAVVKLTYTPPGGTPATLRTRVTLKQG